MSVRSEVLLWAIRVLGKKNAQPHNVLEIKPDATLDEAQAAFHKIARMAHPDLHRSSLTPDELEQVEAAYSRCAAAYQELRTVRTQTGRMRVIQDPGVPSTQAIPVAPAPGSAPPMSSKATVAYRKAESSLRRGDLTGAVLHLKMAIAADPQSALLRTALAEVEAEVGKKAK